MHRVVTRSENQIGNYRYLLSRFTIERNYRRIQRLAKV